MEVSRCYGCGAVLDNQNDSKAHIIPNALGGRLAPKDIICRTCNTTLDSIADNALVSAFGSFPTLIDIPRQQGKNSPKIVETRKGHKVRLNADGSLARINIQYDVSKAENGHKLEVGAGDMKTFRQLLNRAAKEFPQFDPNAEVMKAQVIDASSDDELRLRLDYSPQAAFGGVVTAIWLYLIHKTGRAFMDWDCLLKCIKNVQKDGGTFRYFINGLPGLRGPQIDIGHKIIVRSVPASGELIAYIEMLGVLKIGGVFAKSPNQGYMLEHIYAYDLLGKSDRSKEFYIDNIEFNKQVWSSVGLAPTNVEKLREHFKAALGVFENCYKGRFFKEDNAQ